MIMEKRDLIISSVKDRIYRIDPDAKIFLFGSRAREDFVKDSDWDFLILTSKKVDRKLKNKIFDELFESELETDQVLTGVVQNKKSWEQYAMTPFYQNIQKDGVEV
jgi:predicted nucleotidyltransferase